MRRMTILALWLTAVFVAGCDGFDKGFGGKKEPASPSSAPSTQPAKKSDHELAGIQIKPVGGATSAPAKTTSAPAGGSGLSYTYGAQGKSSPSGPVGKPTQHPDAGKTKAPSAIDRPVMLTDLVEGADKAKNPKATNLQAENIDAAQPTTRMAVPSTGTEVVGPQPVRTETPAVVGATSAPTETKSQQSASPLVIVSRSSQPPEQKEPSARPAIEVPAGLTDPTQSGTQAKSPTPTPTPTEAVGSTSKPVQAKVVPAVPSSEGIGVGAVATPTPMPSTSPSSPTPTAAGSSPKEASLPPMPEGPDITAVDHRKPTTLSVGQTEIIEASIVQVGKRVFTVDNVLGGAADVLAAIPRSSEDSFRSEATKIITAEINRLVTHEMILAEARIKLSDDQVKEIDREMDEVKRDMIAEYGTERALAEAIKARGRTLEEVLEEHRGELMIQLFLQYKFIPAIVINRDMLLKYYQEHKAEFSSPKKVQMQTISIPFAEFLPKDAASPTDLEISAAKAKAREQINLAAAELMSGADFGAVSAKYSRGTKANDQGLWPLMPAGSFKETKVENVAFALPEGKVSPIVETTNAFYIVKTVKVEEGYAKSFEDAQGKIETTLRKEQHDKLANEYFDKLQKRSQENYSQNFLKLAVDRAVERYFRGRASSLR